MRKMGALIVKGRMAAGKDASSRRGMEMRRFTISAFSIADVHGTEHQVG